MMKWRPPKLEPAQVEVIDPLTTPDPSGYARRWLPEDATAVVERHADVKIVTLREVAFDDQTTYVHAFSETARGDFRATRIAGGWLVDAVRENGSPEGSRTAWSRAGRHLCLGKSMPDDGPGTAMQEARIRPYRLPLSLPANSNACIEFVDYYAENSDTGDLHCFAHRAVAIRNLS